MESIKNKQHNAVYTKRASMKKDNKDKAYHVYILVICLMAIALSATAKAQETNCSITTVTISDSSSGTIIGVIIYLLPGCAALYFLPKIIGDPDPKLQTTWKGIVNDAWRRAIYIGILLTYFVAGAWLYDSSSSLNIDMGWMFIMLAYLLGLAMFVLFAYMMLKIIADALALMKKYTEAQRYGRDWHND